jgi:ABC-2 type transport system ATP-binding protein
VARVTATDASGTAFEVESESGRDVRRELASAVIGGGWGLVELRPMRLSLEDVFLSLTTEERQEETVNA